MKIEYRPYQLDLDEQVLQRQHDEEARRRAPGGRARRVYVSVMNSRSAANEMNDEQQRSRRRLPKTKARPITSTITHHALMRALRLSMTSRAAGPCATSRLEQRSRRARRRPARRRCRRTAWSVCCWSSGGHRPSGGAQREQRVARARDERVLVLARGAADRRAERQRAQQRHAAGACPWASRGSGSRSTPARTRRRGTRARGGRCRS